MPPPTKRRESLGVALVEEDEDFWDEVGNFTDKLASNKGRSSPPRQAYKPKAPSYLPTSSSLRTTGFNFGGRKSKNNSNCASGIRGTNRNGGTENSGHVRNNSRLGASRFFKQRKNPSLPLSPAERGAIPEWSCAHCSFNNPSSKAICGACGRLKAAASSRPGAGGAALKTSASGSTARRSSIPRRVISINDSDDGDSDGVADTGIRGPGGSKTPSRLALARRRVSKSPHTIYDVPVRMPPKQFHAPVRAKSSAQPKRGTRKVSEAASAPPNDFALRLQQMPHPPLDDTYERDYCAKALETWEYPSNEKFPVRDYQRSIVQAGLTTNTLVVLPTGLGKTFIAAVVMHNYFRWFPTGKIIFMAPTRPLVSQQVHACQSIVGFKESSCANLQGSTKKSKRLEMWKSKRVFYCTPQTVKNDLVSLPDSVVKEIMLVVVDEAHRACGNYAFVCVVDELRRRNCTFRTLALSATPGTNKKKVQEVIDNLHISKIEYRSETDVDVKKYVFNKLIQHETVPVSQSATSLLKKFAEFIRAPWADYAEAQGLGLRTIQ